MTNGKGFGSMKREEDPYQEDIGQWVEIVTPQSTIMGVYNGLNEHGDLVVRPSLIVEFHPSDNGKPIRLLHIVDRPSYANYQARATLSAVRKEYVDSMVRRREIIIPSRNQES